MHLAVWIAVWLLIAGVSIALSWLARRLEPLDRPFEPEWLWRWAFYGASITLIATFLLFALGVWELFVRFLGVERPEGTQWFAIALPLSGALVTSAAALLRAMLQLQRGGGEWQLRRARSLLKTSTTFTTILLWLSFIALIFFSLPLFLVFGGGLLMSRGAQARSQRVTLLWMLAAATRTGRPLHTEIRAWAEITPARQRRRLEQAADLLEQGRPLSDALDLARLLPAASFPRLHLAEQTGAVPATLADLAREETDQLQPATEQTSPLLLGLYMALVPTMMSAIVGFLMYYIIPKFKRIFEDFGTELPPITISLITASDSFVNYWYLLSGPFAIAGIVAVAITGFSLYYPWLEFRRKFLDPWIISLAMTDVMRNLAHQIRFRRPLPEALRDVGNYCLNWTVRIRLGKVREQVAAGGDLWDEMAAQKLITRREQAVLQSTRQTGHPDWGLYEVAGRRERNWGPRFVWLMTLLRVGIPLSFGVLVGSISIALFAPLVKLLVDLPNYYNP